MRPKLRQDLEIKRISHGGSEVFLLRDPQNIAKELALLPLHFGPVLALADGQNDLELLKRAGLRIGIPEVSVDQLIMELDQGLFLESDNFSLHFQEELNSWNALKVRKPALTGGVYSADKAILESELAGYVGGAEAVISPINKDLRAVICPHIDYRRGHQTYGATFRYLSSANRPDVIFLLGTSHQLGNSRFILTEKDFETPLGIVQNDIDSTAALAKLFGKERSLKDEILHRPEHSLELQLPFLNWLYKENMPRIVPILVGSFYDGVFAGKDPLEYSDISDFVSALTEVFTAVLKGGRKAWLYGGVDLAHVGIAFGDAYHVSSTELALIEQRDRKLLEALAENSPAKLFQHIAEDKDRRRICGFPSTYTMLSVMNRLNERYATELIEYRQAVDKITDCTVSFAGMAWGIQ